MLKPDDYINLIEEIRNTDIKSLDEYIDKVITPLREENQNLLEKLYKDINYLIKDIDKKGENNLAIENGDLGKSLNELAYYFRMSGRYSEMKNLYMKAINGGGERGGYTEMQSLGDYYFSIGNFYFHFMM